jgi:hypothetical protein
MPLRGKNFERQLVQVEQAVVLPTDNYNRQSSSLHYQQKHMYLSTASQREQFSATTGTWRAYRELRLISNAGSVITTKFGILGFYTFTKAETDNRQEVDFQLGFKYHSTKPKSSALTSFLLSPVGSYHPLSFCAFLFTPFLPHVCFPLVLLFPPFFSSHQTEFLW